VSVTNSSASAAASPSTVLWPGSSTRTCTAQHSVTTSGTPQGTWACDGPADAKSRLLTCLQCGSCCNKTAPHPLSFQSPHAPHCCTSRVKLLRIPIPLPASSSCMPPPNSPLRTPASQPPSAPVPACALHHPATSTAPGQQLQQPPGLSAPLSQAPLAGHPLLHCCTAPTTAADLWGGPPMSPPACECGQGGGGAGRGAHRGG
jgi:hypothetical protein